MNRFTRSMSGLLAFMAIWLAPQNGFGCDIVVVGAQPVVVNITLDQITGSGTLSGMNISAFVQGNGPGCTFYRFYDPNDPMTPIEPTVMFDCDDVQAAPHPFLVSIWNGSDPNTESSTALLHIYVRDLATPKLFCPTGLSPYSTDLACQLTDNSLAGDFAVQEVFAPDYADVAGETSDNCSIDKFFYSKSMTFSASATGTTQVTSLDNPTFLFPFEKGTTYLAYTVKDKRGLSKTCLFSVVVEDTEPPVLTGNFSTITIASCDPIPTLVVTATDNCGTPPIVFTEDSTPNPDSTTCGHYTYNVTQKWETTDASGNMATQTRQVLVQDTVAPTINLPATMLVMTAANAVTCDAPISLSLTYAAIADCVTDSLLIVSNDAPFGNGREDASGDYPPGQYIITFSVEDRCANVTEKEITLTVLDGTSPQVACQTSINVSLNNLGNGMIGVSQVMAGLPSDNCTSQNDLLASATISQSTFSCANVAAPVTVVLTVTDNSSNSTTCTTQVFTQDNTAPTIACPADVTFSCTLDQTMIGAPTVSDACTNPPTVTFIESTTSNGTHCFITNRIWSATDASGNAAHCPQKITVEDLIKPVLSGVPADTVLACGSAIPAATVTANDNCAGSILVMETSQVIPSDCANFNDPISGKPLKSITIRIWRAEDACGNSIMATQSIHFIDTIAPNVSAVPTSLAFYAPFNACAANVLIDLDENLITDNCSAFTVSPASVSFSNKHVGQYSHVFTIADECHNSQNLTINYEVEDTITPQMVCQQSLNVTLTNTGYATITQNDVLISASDNCGIESISLSTTTFSCADASLEPFFGPTILTIFAFDTSGNYATCDVAVHVTAPAGLGIAIDTVTTTDPTFFGAADGTAAIGNVSGGSGQYIYGFFDGGFTQIGTSQSIGGLESGLFWAGAQDTVTTCIDLYSFFLDDGGLPHFAVDSVDGAAGDTVCIAVTVEDFKNIRSVEMDLSVLDASVASVFEVQNAQAALFSMAVSAGNDFTISLVSTDTISRNLADGDTLFIIKAKLTGGLGDTTSVDIIDGSVEVTTSLTDTVSSTHTDGFVVISSGLPDSEISGRVYPWWNSAIGVSLVDVDLNNGLDNYVTNSTGFYSFQTNTGQPVVLTPFKDRKTANGVTVADLFTIQQHILGNPTMHLTGYRQIAADATRDKKISTFDLVNLQYIILNPTASLPNNTSWRFVPSNFVFPDANNVFASAFPENRAFILTGDTAQNDFVAIKIGDVNGTSNVDSLIQNPPVDDRSPMLFSIKDHAIKKGETVHVELLANDFSNQLGWQMTLGWDTQLLDYQQVTPAAALFLNEKNFGESEVEKGQLTAAWFASAPKNLVNGSAIFSLDFVAKMDAPSLEGLLEINSEITPAVSVSSFGETTVRLAFDQKSLEPTDIETLRIQPNPMTDATIIDYVLPIGESTEAVWTVFEATGRVVKTAIEKVEKGSNLITLDRGDLSAAGTYFFEIRTAAGVLRKQIVVVD